MKLDVIGFGALNLDKLYRVERIAVPGEESFIIDTDEAFGGSAANTVVGLSRLGMRTGYIGKLSKDEVGRCILNDFINENVDVHGVVISKKGTSGVVYCFIDKQGERAMYVHPGINDSLILDEINLEYCSNTEFLHLTSFIGEKPYTAQKKLTQILKNVKLSLDPGMIYAVKGLQALKPLLKNCHVFFPNEHEVKLLTGEDFKKGTKQLLEQGVNIVVVKLGNRGCYVTDGGEEHLITASNVNVIDTTGAGDAFCAGFLYGLLKRKDLYTCGKLGNYVASRKIEKKGARKGLPSQSDLPP